MQISRLNYLPEEKYPPTPTPVPELATLPVSTLIRGHSDEQGLDLLFRRWEREPAKDDLTISPPGLPIE